ncbi:MAG: hypothetical protein IKO61_00270 [Lachnospiraceae bacterium]|nr:hypothetical protein [Lachnospiraceae bacterium]
MKNIRIRIVVMMFAVIAAVFAFTPSTLAAEDITLKLVNGDNKTASQWWAEGEYHLFAEGTAYQKAITPRYKITVGGKTYDSITDAKDIASNFTVSGTTKASKKGIFKITVTGKGDYVGKKASVYYKVNGAALMLEVEIDETSLYDGTDKDGNKVYFSEGETDGLAPKVKVISNEGNVTFDTKKDVTWYYVKKGAKVTYERDYNPWTDKSGSYETKVKDTDVLDDEVSVQDVIDPLTRKPYKGAESAVTTTKPSTQGDYFVAAVILGDDYYDPKVYVAELKIDEMAEDYVSYDISKATIYLKENAFVYTGKFAIPAIEKVMIGKRVLSEDDYNAFAYIGQAAGEYYVRIEGRGEYTGAKVLKYKVTPKSIATSTISVAAADQVKAWTGSAVKIPVTVKDGSKTLKEGLDYALSYKDNVNAGTATVTVTGMGNYSGELADIFTIKKPVLKYRAYVQKKSWLPWSVANVASSKESTMAGTTDNLRMETIQMQLSGVSGQIDYRAYVQTLGWTQWATTADTTTYAGTKGQSKRVEMIQLKATGEVASLYDIYYRAYSENFGWLGWAGNGDKAGTAGYAYKLEAFQVNFMPKGATFAPAKNSTVKAFYDKTKDGANPLQAE